MKKNLLLLGFLLLNTISFSQLSVSYSFDGTTAIGNLDDQDLTKFSDETYSDDLKKVYFRVDNPATASQDFEVFDMAGAPIPNSTIKDNGAFVKVVFPSSILEIEYTIAKVSTSGVKDPAGPEMKFTMAYDEPNNEEDVDNDDMANSPVSIYQQINGLASTLTRTKLGLMDNDGRIHLIFDQYGNSLLSTVPQGVASREYVTHVFYLDSEESPTVRYSIKQTKGSFYNGLILENSNANEFQLESGTNQRWYVNTTFLRPSNKDDIDFEIKRTVFESGQTTTVGTHTINMVPSYHATFNIGLLYSNLNNPTFELANLTDTTSTVKRTNSGGRGAVAITATLYSSPLVLLQRIFAKDDLRKRELDAKLASRNYLDDHKWFEKIYPTVGIMLGDRSFENLLLGFNFEFARGGNIFLGGHLGKVNTFSGDFEFGTETISSNQFNLRSGTAWNWGFVYGVNLDLRIVQGLFGND